MGGLAIHVAKMTGERSRGRGRGGRDVIAQMGRGRALVEDQGSRTSSTARTCTWPRTSRPRTTAGRPATQLLTMVLSPPVDEGHRRRPFDPDAVGRFLRALRPRPASRDFAGRGSPHRSPPLTRFRNRTASPSTERRRSASDSVTFSLLLALVATASIDAAAAAGST